MNKYIQIIENNKELIFESMSNIYKIKIGDNDQRCCTSDNDYILKESFIKSDEHTILQKINHDSIIKYHNYIEHKKKYYLITEYFDGKNLKSFNFKDKKDEIIKIFNNLIKTIEYLHNNHIVHFDISRSNVLYDGKIIKLIDFNSSFCINNKTEFVNDNMFGRWQNIAPITLNEGNTGYFNDIWALGILLYNMTYNREPFNRRSYKFENIYYNKKYEKINKIIKYILGNYLEINISDLIIFLD